MDGKSVPAVKDLVLVGGGHSHVTVLRRFGMRPMPGVRLTLVCRDAHAPYSGMLPGLIAGHYEFDDAHIDLGPLSRFAGARFIHDEVVGLDPDAGTLTFRERPPLPYDLLSINIGSRPRTEGVPGAREHAVPVKPIDGFFEHWERLRRRCLDRQGASRIAVVGGGAGGVELLLSVQHRLGRELAERGSGGSRPEFHLVTASDDVLPRRNARVQRKFERVLLERGVEVHPGARVERLSREDDGTRLHWSGTGLTVDEVLWVTTAAPQPWPGEAGLAVDEDGFIRVDDTLCSTSHRDVFAAGDIAAVVDHPRPKAGVFAVRQGPPLEENLRRLLLGRPLKPYRPQRRFLTIISTGDRHAVASRSFWAVEGDWVWRWKDWIDRRFVARFNELPEMSAEATPYGASLAPGLADEEALQRLGEATMRCGGCGAKVGSGILERALARLEPVRRDDVPVGLDAPDDAALLELAPGELLVQTVDHFRSMIDDPWVFGRIAANHAMGDIWAMGAEPRTALAVVTLPFGLESKQEEELTQLLAGALEQFRPENVALVGGHTTEGPETSLGFAVSGAVRPAAALRKSGLQPGNVLVLTKPLGTGALLAADMRGRSKGRWIEAAIESMCRSSAVAARLLVDAGCGAMTDVTGFGLVGHLHEMARASGVALEVEVDAVPLLDGAVDVISQGIFSSLQPDNLRLRRVVDRGSHGADAPAFSLLFDPQTAGGLVAGVPEAEATGTVDALRRAGNPDAAIIGRVVAPGAGATIRLR